MFFVVKKQLLFFVYVSLVFAILQIFVIIPFAITLLSKIAFAALTDYTDQLKDGINPVFRPERIPGLKNAPPNCPGSSALTIKQDKRNKIITLNNRVYLFIL